MERMKVLGKFTVKEATPEELAGLKKILEDAGLIARIVIEDDIRSLAILTEDRDA